MSVPPPGYETPHAPPTAPQEASATAQNRSRQPDDNVRYELKTVRTLRSRERSTKAKWQQEGWEVVAEEQGTVRTELNLRRVKPKTPGAHLLNFVATLRRMQPKTRLVLVASSALILGASIIGIVVGTQAGSDSTKPSAAQTEVSPASPADATPTAAVTAPSADSRVTDTTVDELVAKLNAGGPSVGDQFRVTGELVASDRWTTGASGDFFVMLKTTEGAELEVFIDETDANGWHDGTMVEMVVKTVEVTIDGETTPGFFRAQSAKTISGGTSG
jgi:hypothetical protein